MMPASPSSATKDPAVEASCDNPSSATESPVATPMPIPSLRTPKRRRRRDPSPIPDNVSASPGSPDSVVREIAARRVGERSLTPYPPPMYSPRVIYGTRSVTPYPGLRRRHSRGSDTSSTHLSSSPDKENESFIRSSAPSPSPKKKGKLDGEVRGRSLSRTGSNDSLDSVFTFGVPTNTPRSLSPDSTSSDTSTSAKSVYEPPTPPMIARILEDRLLEIAIVRRCKELTESPLADVTDAYTDVFGRCDAGDILCPPNTPVTAKTPYN